MEAADAKLGVKLAQFKLAVQKTEGVLAKATQEAIARNLKGLIVITGEVEQNKRAVEELKIERKIEIEQIMQWNDSIDEKIGTADAAIARINS